MFGDKRNRKDRGEEHTGTNRAKKRDSELLTHARGTRKKTFIFRSARCADGIHCHKMGLRAQVSKNEKYLAHLGILGIFTVVTNNIKV